MTQYSTYVAYRYWSANTHLPRASPGVRGEATYHVPYITELTYLPAKTSVLCGTGRVPWVAGHCLMCEKMILLETVEGILTI